MKVLQIANVAEKKDAAGKVVRTYATSAAGLPLFANKTITLVKGQFAIVNETEQTQTYGADGTLVALATPIKINQIVSVWESKAEAIAALYEEQANAIDGEAYLASLRGAAAPFNVNEALKQATGA